MPELFKTPILLLTFNRLETTKRVFAEIMKVNPAQLFIAQDGPRKSKPGEAERCRQVREIFKEANPECEVKTLFREKNLGMKLAVVSAITWFFENIEEGIILEDDCLPHPDFFRFCQELLERYRNNEKVMHIIGTNLNPDKKTGSASYYFSKFFVTWGSATWRRTWKYYDINMKTWPEFLRQNRMFEISKDRRIREWWIDLLQSVYRAAYRGKMNVFSYPLLYAIWNQGGFVVCPNTNLISNIGFGEDATHTRDKNSGGANRKTYPIGEIVHPILIKRTEEKIGPLLLAKRIERLDKKQPWKVILPLPETLFKLFLSSIHPVRYRHKAYIYKEQAKYFFCMLVYKTLGRKSAVKLAEIIEPDEE